MERIHKIPYDEAHPVRVTRMEQNVEFLDQNVILEEQNVEQMGQNVEHVERNVILEVQNVEYVGQNVEFRCGLCQKVLSCKKSLHRHRIICTESSNPLECKFCNRIFNTRSAKSKHIQKCKIETQRSIQNSIEEKQKTSSTSVIIPEKSDSLIPTQPSSVTCTGNVVNSQSVIHKQTNNTQNNNTQNNTVIINAFGKEDISHITPEFISRCIRMANNTGIHNMVKEVHLNPNVPSNHNVRVRSSKKELMEIFNDESRWQIQDKTFTLDNIIRGVCDKMMEHYQENTDDIRTEDGDKEYYYYRKLIEVANQSPIIRYYNLRKQVYASVLDFTKYRMTISIEPSDSESIIPIPSSTEVQM